MKKCAWCENTLPLTSFWRQVNASDGRQDICKGCHSVRVPSTSAGRRVAGTRIQGPVRRRSPYDNMKTVLDSIEQVTQEGAVRELIDRARTRFVL